MSVPLHFTPDGVPIGSQFAAAPGRDARLLALAYELEAARPWAQRWAPHSFVCVAGA
jgi:amidase